MRGKTGPRPLQNKPRREDALTNKPTWDRASFTPEFFKNVWAIPKHPPQKGYGMIAQELVLLKLSCFQALRPLSAAPLDAQALPVQPASPGLLSPQAQPGLMVIFQGLGAVALF